MKIAICDDEQIASKTLKGIIEETFSELTHQYEIKLYSSADSLLQYLKENPRYFQIYFLDIEMAGTNGLEAAKKIRAQDAETILIFATSHGELMSEAFHVLAFQFIIKPFKEETVKKILLSAIKLLESRRTLYTYIIRKKIHSIYLSEIEAIESRGRKTILNTINGEKIEYYGKLRDAKEKVSSLTFAQPHKSFLVNLEKIAILESWLIVMQSGLIINISNLYHDTFHKAYRIFVLSRANEV